MDSIVIGWNKYSSDEVHYVCNRQSFQQDATEKINHQGKKQAFENIELNHLATNQRQRSSFEDQDSILSSTNIFRPQLRTINDETLCSARAIVVTFIIIVLIIVAVAIAIGVVFSIIKTGSNSNVTRNVDQSSLSTVSTIVLTSSVSIGSQNGAPCLSYTTINDPSRNVLQIGSYRACDNGPLFNASNDGAWIRFIGSGGTKIASSSPGVNHCGGYSTAWFNGSLPITIGTMVNASICFTTDSADCMIDYDSSVIYCAGSFYIYFLQPITFCNTRFCTI